MLHIVLYEPEIPPNTGNIIRLCANTGARLHLIQPMGFSLTDKQCRRAGLDYEEYANIQVYDNLADCYARNPDLRFFGCTTKAEQQHDQPRYTQQDAFLFGPESRGLPTHVLNALPDTQKIRIPMQPTSRSLNLSNACSIILYEAWRQLNFIPMA